jgi:hypothetical protein
VTNNCRGQTPGRHHQVSTWRRGNRPGHHEQVPCPVFVHAQNEHREQAQAPHTKGPRDVPRC